MKVLPEDLRVVGANLWDLLRAMAALRNFVAHEESRRGPENLSKLGDLFVEFSTMIDHVKGDVKLVEPELSHAGSGSVIAGLVVEADLTREALYELLGNQGQFIGGDAEPIYQGQRDLRSAIEPVERRQLAQWRAQIDTALWRAARIEQPASSPRADKLKYFCDPSVPPDVQRMVEFLNGGAEDLSLRAAARKAADVTKGSSTSIESRFRRHRDKTKLIRLL
jgi:hypothetical protein